MKKLAMIFCEQWSNITLLEPVQVIMAPFILVRIKSHDRCLSGTFWGLDIKINVPQMSLLVPSKWRNPRSLVIQQTSCKREVAKS